MHGYRRILMATDFSPASEAALAEAAKLARESGALLSIVHAYDAPADASVPYMPPSDGFESLAAVRLSAEVRLEELLRREVLRDLGARPIAVRGDAAREIVETARREKADLIVMGTHGRRGAARLLLGSVSARVIAAAECPVLTVRDTDPRASLEAPAA